MKLTRFALLAGATFLTAVATAHAEGFSYEGSLELGINSAIDAPTPADEFTDAYATGELALEYEFSNGITAFAGLTAESVTDATKDRAFEDIGLYVDSLGVNFALGSATVTIGKFAPAFGLAWDAAPGYFGADFAEDYEIAEQIGIGAEFDVAGGTLALSTFYADNTGLTESLGENRGRSRVADGGNGNTGKLNNFAVQFTKEFGATTAHAGALFLAKGISETEDTKGLSLGVTHAISDDFEIIAELAHFDGWEGTSNKATYATLGGAYGMGNFTYSASVTSRKVSGTASDTLASLGVDYAINDMTEINAGLGFADEGGANTTSAALAVVFSF
ncbi:MAG: porin [Halocynthiibacter sp.]